MNINFRKIEEWEEMGDKTLLPETRSRKVVLEVQPKNKVELAIQTDGGEMYLGTYDGYVKLEFRVTGQADLLCKGKAWFKCTEAQQRTVSPSDNTTFTKVVERAPRNPQLELMMAKMNQAVDKRMIALERDSNARISKAEARAALAERAARESSERIAARNHDAGTSAGIADATGDVPEPDQD